MVLMIPERRCRQVSLYPDFFTVCSQVSSILGLFLAMINSSGSVVTLFGIFESEVGHRLIDAIY